MAINQLALAARRKIILTTVSSAGQYIINVWVTEGAITDHPLYQMQKNLWPDFNPHRKYLPLIHTERGNEGRQMPTLLFQVNWMEAIFQVNQGKKISFFFGYLVLITGKGNFCPFNCLFKSL